MIEGIHHLYFIIDYHEEEVAVGEEGEKWILVYSNLFGGDDRVYWMKWGKEASVLNIWTQDDSYGKLNNLDKRLHGDQDKENTPDWLIGQINDIVDKELVEKIKNINLTDHLYDAQRFLYRVKRMMLGWNNIKKYINDKVTRLTRAPGAPGASTPDAPGASTPAGSDVELYKEYVHYFRCRWIPLMVKGITITCLIKKYQLALIDRAGQQGVFLNSHNLLTCEDYQNYLYNILWALFKEIDKRPPSPTTQYGSELWKSDPVLKERRRYSEAADKLEESICIVYKDKCSEKMLTKPGNRYLLKMFNYINPVINAIDHKSLLDAMEKDPEQVASPSTSAASTAATDIDDAEDDVDPDAG